MRGLLKRRPAETPGRGQDAPGRAAVPAPGPRTSPATACALLTCPGCGLRLETLALRCPRCRTDIPLGCSGNCRECGKAAR